jgi:hypothetical protein
MRHRYLILASVLGLAFAVPSLAQTTYSCFLNATNEVPANASPALGSCVVVLNAAGTQVSITCQFVNLIGTYTASHLHGAAGPGVNAGVQIGFVGVPAGWIFANANHDGSLTNFVSAITPAQVAMLNNGTMYANVHSNQFPGGEIRGQLASPGPTATSKSTWSRVKALYR